MSLLYEAFLYIDPSPGCVIIVTVYIFRAVKETQTVTCSIPVRTALGFCVRLFSRRASPACPRPSEPSASPAKDNYRMNRYKNKALNPEEMRRRREEEGVQLRKQKREQQVSDRRLLFLNLSCVAFVRL